MSRTNAERQAAYRARQRELNPPKPRELHPCGTRAAAARHRRSGDIPDGQKLADVCPKCAQAERDYQNST